MTAAASLSGTGSYLLPRGRAALQRPQTASQESHRV